jgi:hypothetical protein
MSRESRCTDIRAAIAFLATPIDFTDLVARGLLKKAGGSRTYWLLKPLPDLPEHACRQIVAMQWTTNGTRVRFQDCSRAAKRLLEKIDA